MTMIVIIMMMIIIIMVMMVPDADNNNDNDNGNHCNDIIADHDNKKVLTLLIIHYHCPHLGTRSIAGRTGSPQGRTRSN
jgi:hypothetical protein